MTALPAPRVRLEVVPDPAPSLTAVPDPAPAPPRPLPRTPDYDWPASPALELWALKVRLEALCRKGDRREGWVSCRLIRRAMG